MDASALQIGNPKQQAYAQRLAREAGYDTLVDACADALGIDPDQVIKQPVSVADASRVIAHLQVKAESATPPTKDPARRRQAFLTPRSLRRIATGQQRAPADIDEDAAWVLEWLGKALAVSSLFSDEPTTKAINGDQPIAMEHLLAFYKSWDDLAKAFSVTVSTAKGWGVLLPASRAFEAEVRTRGYVRAPRPTSTSSVAATG